MTFLRRCSVRAARARGVATLVLATLAAVLPLVLPAASQAARVLVMGAGGRVSATQAARVLVMGAGGRVSATQDAFVPALVPSPDPAVLSPAVLSPAVLSPAVAAPARGLARSRRAAAPQSTVTTDLARLRSTGAITPGLFSAYSASFAGALRAEKRLRGTRASELEAVIENLHQIAAGGMFIPSRLPALFETLDRNRQWWTTGPLLSSGQYVEFAGSQLVWEYYPGQGIELQVLATFGKADGLYAAGPADYSQMEALLSQMIPLAVERAGGLTWEYYFRFDGGSPPWTSAMSQGTGIEALTRAYEASGDDGYLQLAHRALAVFTVAPPAGVRVDTPLGARYVQYSSNPRASILNAFLQALIGLYDYARRAKIRWRRGCSPRATPRPRPRCRTSTRGRGRSISPAWRTPSVTTSS